MATAEAEEAGSGAAGWARRLVEGRGFQAFVLAPAGPVFPRRQQAVLPQRPWAWLYFGSFVIVGVFIVIYLFIAVVLNNLETVKAEEAEHERRHEAPAGTEEVLLREIADLRARLADFEARLRERNG